MKSEDFILINKDLSKSNHLDIFAGNLSKSDNLSSFEDFGEESSESSIEIPPPSKVKFNSLHIILPSEKESCSLDNVNKIEKKVTINDFLLIKSLASGAFGKVILSRKKNTKDMFAIKVLEIEKMK